MQTCRAHSHLWVLFVQQTFSECLLYTSYGAWYGEPKMNETWNVPFRSMQTSREIPVEHSVTVSMMVAVVRVKQSTVGQKRGSPVCEKPSAFSAKSSHSQGSAFTLCKRQGGVSIHCTPVIPLFYSSLLSSFPNLGIKHLNMSCKALLHRQDRIMVWSLGPEARQQDFSLCSTTYETGDLGQKFFVPQFLHL